MNFALPKDADATSGEQWTPDFDAALKLWIGERDEQEDAIIAQFEKAAGYGVAVLADGMGGHASGEIASALITEEVFEEIWNSLDQMRNQQQMIPDYLKRAALLANDAIGDVVTAHPALRGMGATLVALFIDQDRLSWLSIGDSPLYRIRDGRIDQLNEDHSMAPDIDLMVANGMMRPEVGRNHPDRNTLKSAVAGFDIRMLDCRSEPTAILPGDIYVLSSDGLQTLSNDTIRQIVISERDQSAACITMSLMTAVQCVENPDQDNTSILVIKVDDKDD